MNLIQKLLSPLMGKSAVAGVPVSVNDPATWPRESGRGLVSSESSVLGLSAAWACVNLLAGTIASMPLMVYRTGANGSRTLAKDHPLYRVLHDSPNFDQTAVDFWEGGQMALELRGNLHARIERAGGRIVALDPIYNAQARREPDGYIRYRWSQDGRSFDEPQENVFHVRGFGGGPLGGLSTLSYGRQVFGLSSQIHQAAQQTFENGVRPSGLLSTDKFLNEQRDVIEAKLIEKFTGAMNAGRPMVLEGGLKWSQLSINPEDAQMLESRAFSIEEVCRMFGVPPHMIGHTVKSTSFGTGLEQQTLGFVIYTLRRRLKRIEQAIMKQLLTPADRAAGIIVEFSLEGLLRGDSAGRASFYQSALANGWMTINEVRGYENLPPVKGGDIPRMQMQNVPITEAGKITAIPQTDPDAEDEGEAE